MRLTRLLIAAGTPHDADGLPGLDVQVDVLENRPPLPCR